MKNIVVPLVFSMLACVASPICASEPETFRVGVCLSLTGDFSSFGRVQLAGVRIGADDFNRRSAVTGVRVELIVRDDESVPARGAEIVEELADGNVVAIIGSNSSGVTLAMLEPARRRRVPIITPSATSNDIGGGGDVAFRVLFNDAFQGVALARFIRDNLDSRRAALMVNDAVAYGREVADAFAGVWTDGGREIVADESYRLDMQDPDSHDFRPLLDRARNAGAELVVFPGYPDEVAAVLNQSQEMGFRVLFCGGDSWQHDSILLAAGNYLENCYHVGYLDEHGGRPEMYAFMELLDESNDLSAEPASVLGYDALELLLAAVLKGGRDREGIIDRLYSIANLPLASGDITLDRVEGTKKSAYIMRFEAGSYGFERRVVTEIRP